MTGTKEEKTELPSPEYQAPILFVFKKIAVKERTPEGKVWTPKRILFELWDFLDEDQKKARNKLQFVDAYLQIISRIKREVTKQYIRDPLLFGLIYRFVGRYAGPGGVKPPFSQIRLIYDAAEKLAEFCRPMHREYAYADWKSAFVENDGKTRIGVYLLTDYHKLAGDKRAMYLSEKYLGYKIPLEFEDWKSRPWTVVFFDPNSLYLELGFYLPAANMVFLRSIAGSDHGFSFDKEVNTVSGYNDLTSFVDNKVIKEKNFRILDIGRSERSGSREEIGVARQKMATRALQLKRIPNLYSILKEENEEVISLASKYLAFLDI
ncbi:MAG: hypothetical protein H6868_00085 [Rhodospirillales bacterium]|nr:hypothetical protein [Rhodospirillales bacterium]